MECHHDGDLSIHKRLVEFWQGHNIQALANKVFKMIIPRSAECDVITKWTRRHAAIAM